MSQSYNYNGIRAGDHSSQHNGNAYNGAFAGTSNHGNISHDFRKEICRDNARKELYHDNARKEEHHYDIGNYYEAEYDEPTLEEELLGASKAGNAQLVQALVDEGADINCADDQRKRAIHHAVCSEDVDTVETLLLAGAGINSKYIISGLQEPQRKITALHAAAYGRSLQILELLIHYGADINMRCAVGPPIFYATRPESLEMLIANGANTRLRNEIGQTVLHRAARAGREQCVEILARHNPADIDLEDRSSKQPALIHAARSGSANCVRILLRYGAGVDIPDAKQRTALIHAAAQGYVDVVEVLLKAKASKKWTDHKGRMAIDYAQGRCHDRVVAVLAKPRLFHW